MLTRPSRARARATVFVCALAALAAGCGGGEETTTPEIAAGEPLGEGGTLVWAVGQPLSDVDPLDANTRAAQLLARQIHEPLIAELSGPFGDTRRVPGLVRSARPSGDATLWTLKLRRGVRFQDGSPFNAQAVLANAERWRTTLEGQTALPGLVDAFAPRFDVVTFILAAPDPDLDVRLASPRLGIVSPRALRPASGTAAVVRKKLDTGTGPFALREGGASHRVLVRNASWWGASGRSELGPALDQVELRFEDSAMLRLALLDAGDVQLADQLGREQAEQAEADPLLDSLPGSDETWLGISRAVRGIESGREIPSLSSAWLTALDPSE